MMKPKYDHIAVEKQVEELWEELEPKIVKEICKKFNRDPEDENKSLDEIHMGLGFCHLVWSIQKKILKRDYGIVWKSPAELNPTILYD